MSYVKSVVVVRERRYNGKIARYGIRTGDRVVGSYKLKRVAQHKVDVINNAIDRLRKP